MTEAYEKIRETCMPRGQSIQTTLLILCRHSKFTVSQKSRKIFNSNVSIKSIMGKVCRSPTLMPCWETIIVYKYRNMVRWAALDLSVNSVKPDLSNNNFFNPPLFSLVNTFYVLETRIMYLTRCCWFLKIPEDCCCLVGGCYWDIVHILYPCRWWQGSSSGS